MSQSRQLAAIMFTDIVGYTALMGEDEQKAFELLKKNRLIQRPIIEKFNGRWLKDIGDGVLASFSTVTDAVYCAKEIQETCRNEPDLKLRIGIHEGEVVFEDNDVFGDGVNIASRLEPLAPVGGILVSESVHNNLINKKDVESSYVGEKQLKNVKKPVRVYQVKVEGIERIKPETSTTEPPVIESIEQKPTSKRKVLFTLISIALAILAGWLFWKPFNKTNSTISQSLTESRIAVLPYENKTNDPELDVLGDMAADWIIKGLMNFEDLKIVSYKNVKYHLEYAALGNWDAFSKQTGAETIIKGSFYQQGEQLIFQSQVIDGASGDIIFVLPEITGSKSNTGKIVNDLKQRIMTLFTINIESGHDYVRLIQNNPPAYDAYQNWIRSDEYFVVDYPKAREFLIKAIDLDSSFYWPYVPYVFSYSNVGNYEKADSVFKLIEPLIDKLTPYEKLHYDYLKEAHYGSVGTTYSTFKKVYEKDPNDIFLNNILAARSLWFNKPKASIAVLEQIDLNTFQFKNTKSVWRHTGYAHALIRMERQDEAQKVLSYVPKERADTETYAMKSYLYISLGQQDSLQYMIEKMGEENLPWEQITWTYEYVAYWYSLLEDKTNQLKWAQLNLERIERQSKIGKVKLVTKAFAYYIAERYDDALILYQELSKTQGNNWYSLSRIGIIYAKTNNRVGAEVVIKDLKNINAPITLGRYKYAIAQIYAALNEKELATEYMKHAFNEGFGFRKATYDSDPEFIPLRGYSPYEEFVKPKG